jgi:transcriptional regulator with XRE-family HTH domain
MSDTDASFLRACRKRLGMTQIEFAGLLGISLATIKRYEAATDDVPESVRLSCVVILSLADRLRAIFDKRAA